MLAEDFVKQLSEPIEVHDWDSFLCDLSIFEQLLDVYAEGGKYVFYWVCDGSYTEVRDYQLPVYSGLSRKITLVRGEEITVEVIEPEVLDFSGLTQG